MAVDQDLTAGPLRAIGRLHALTSLALEKRKAPQVPPSRRTQALVLSEAAQRVADTHGIRAVVSGWLPTNGPFILAANHLSYVDPIVLASLTPCIPIAKAELASWPLLGPALGRVGVIFVDRSSRSSGARALRQALHSLRSGVSVLNFVEGSTTTGREVLPFHRGIFGIARIAGVPVVPVALRADDPELPWTGDASFLPHYGRLASREENVLHVSIGAPVHPTGFDSADAMAQAVRHRVCALLAGTHPPRRRTATASLQRDLAAE